MFRRILIICILLACSPLFGETMEYDPQTMNFPVSLQQAQDIARSWIGMPDLVFGRVWIDICDISKHRYVLNTSEGAEQQFFVDCHTGEVMAWWNVTEQRAQNALWDSPNPPAKLTMEQQISLARDFVELKYSGFQDLNLQSTENCRFVRRLPNGVWDMGFIASAGVNRYTGTVMGYFARRSDPLSISPDPLIDLAAAETVALEVAMDAPETSSAWVTGNSEISIERDDARFQRLIWAIEVVTSAEKNYTPEQYQADMPRPYASPCWISVDAHTGEAFDLPDSFFSEDGAQPDKAAPQSDAAKPSPTRGKKISYPMCKLHLNGQEIDVSVPPVVISGEPYLYTRHLSLLGHKVSWKDGRVVVFGDEQVLLLPGSHTAKVGNWEARLEKPVIVLFDRAYIPLSAIRMLFGDVAQGNEGVLRRFRNKLAVPYSPFGAYAREA